jgi:hypothetical protein
MRKSTRRELAKLRELYRFLVRGRRCYFCKRALLETEKVIRDGDGYGAPVKATDVTIHHLDGDHENKARRNEDLAHVKCHKRHHAQTHPRVGCRFVSKKKGKKR